MGQVGDLILVTRDIEGKVRFRTVATNCGLLRLARDSLGKFLHRYLDGIIIIIIIIIIIDTSRWWKSLNIWEQIKILLRKRLRAD